MDYYDLLPKNYVRLLGVDMAGTKAKESSWTGFADGEWDENEHLFLRDAYKKKIAPMEAFTEICNRWDAADKEKRPYTYVVVEREKYGIFLEDLFRSLRPDVYVITLGLKGMPRPRRHHSLQPWYERGAVKARRGLTDYEDQIGSLTQKDTEDENMDIVDAVFMVIEGRIIPKRGMEPPQPEEPIVDPEFKKQVMGDIQQKDGSRGMTVGMF